MISKFHYKPPCKITKQPSKCLLKNPANDFPLFNLSAMFANKVTTYKTCGYCSITLQLPLINTEAFYTSINLETENVKKNSNAMFDCI